ncbi:hypothetical protein [Nannocystis punicea]|uniref:Kazal-type serine protease inhibitor domain-containing protein n=1 Tax=Nannocystis punicea TaxID=2995304 RepID=A0ABY7H9N8_9BACT|nr:hypothetical protein [Nannocystis poenicansa]WAS95810.1 hypothetical protein O0S08_06570 [Nannocystis poenicansa]
MRVQKALMTMAIVAACNDRSAELTETSAAANDDDCAMCGPDEWCDWSDDRCGEGVGRGTCRPRPPPCNLVLRYTCACDGKVYGNECAAQQHGVDVAAGGGCEVPKWLRPCGYNYCEAEPVGYCAEMLPAARGEASTFKCERFPWNCAAHDCSCIEGLPCAQPCLPAEDGCFELTCPPVAPSTT